MSGMRVTLFLRNTEGVKAKLRTTDRANRQYILQEMLASGDRVFNHASQLCAFRSGFMLEHMRLERTRGGYNYAIGWRRVDFDAAGFAFYPVFVVLGTRYQPAQNNLTPALETERPILMARLRRRNR